MMAGGNKRGQEGQGVEERRTKKGSLTSPAKSSWPKKPGRNLLGSYQTTKQKTFPLPEAR